MLHETGETAQHAPPEFPPAQSPGGESGTTQAKPPETYTRAEYEKIRNAMAEQGRKVKVIETERDTRATLLAEAEAKLTTVNTQLEQHQERLDELERAGLSDSPEGVKLLQERQALRKKERDFQKERDDFAKEKATHAEELRIVKEDRFERQVIEAAYELKADAVKLKALCQEFKLTTEEQIRKQAEAIAGSGASAQDAGGNKPGATAGLHVDSARGAGATKDLSTLSPDELIRAGLRILPLSQ